MTAHRPRLGMRATLATLLVAVLACGEGASRPADSTATRDVVDHEASFRAQLGSTWELARLGTREIPPPAAGTPPDTIGRDLVPGRRPTLRFVDSAGPSAGGRSFCNGYGGPFEIRGDSIRMGQIISSAVGCDSQDSLETRFFRGLRLTRRHAMRGDSLVLLADDGSALVFVPAAVRR